MLLNRPALCKVEDTFHSTPDKIREIIIKFGEWK